MINQYKKITTYTTYSFLFNSGIFLFKRKKKNLNPNGIFVLKEYIRVFFLKTVLLIKQ